jgi:hypothetical protein
LVDCAEADGDTFKIVSSLEGAGEKCPKGSEAVVNKKRDLVLCIGAPA